MTEKGVKRKLAAILSADVKGYSRLMGEDELGTVNLLKEYRQVMAGHIQRCGGRVVDAPGDNILSEFASVVDALECAVEVQKELKKRNEVLPDEKKMEFRIGVNLGDVIEDGNRIYGDGINVAARIEGLADAGGVCISGTAFDQIGKKLPFGYEYLGEQTVKNIEKSVRVYRVLTDPESAGKVIGEKRFLGGISRRSAIAALVVLIIIAGGLIGWNIYLHQSRRVEAADPEKMTYPLPDKPSIAVLPFTNMSGDPEQDYIGDGLSENIISALSISSKIFVIARNSSFTYKGNPVKVQQVAEDLGVQYVLEGSIQKSGDRLRVTAQLIDALTGHHLWSEKYDREMKELFALQDEITKKIVVSLQMELTGDEDIRLSAKSTENLEAWIYYIKGLELFWNWNKEENIKAREHFKDAVKLDPEYATAFAHLAMTYYCDAVMGWSKSPPISLKRAFENVQKALKIDQKDVYAHAMLGWGYKNQKQCEKAIAEGELAITLNPNFATGHAFLADIMFFCGQFDEALTLIKKAYRLNPNLPPIWLRVLAPIYAYLGRYEEALEVTKQIEVHAQKDNVPREMAQVFYSWIYQELGREEEARAHMKEALKRFPFLSAGFITMVNPFKNPAHLQRYLDALLKAGMPEKPPRPPS